MQLFPCPFCGLRDETEFHFAAPAGKVRPEPAGEVSAEHWASYLYMKPNPHGASREIWLHLACGEFFLMERDTMTHEVAGAQALRKEADA
jgi:sarcosine oxidase subunit delta